MDSILPKSKLPLYIHSIDWDAHFRESPPPDVWFDTMFKWSRDELRAYQNVHFMARMAEGWNNTFYQKLWGNVGLEPGDVIQRINGNDVTTNDEVVKAIRNTKVGGYVNLGVWSAGLKKMVNVKVEERPADAGAIVQPDPSQQDPNDPNAGGNGSP